VLPYCEECFYEISGDEYKMYFDKIQEDQELNSYEKELLDNKQAIEAIKSLRARTGLGLKDAKDKADEYRYRNRSGTI
jgi:ribosomal protein L7/L12